MPSVENSKAFPMFEPYQIHEKIRKVKKKTSTVFGDTPLSNIYNSSTLADVWPNLWKYEYVTYQT